MPKGPYWNHITPAFLRLVGSLDRTPGSPFEGSMSREVWQYRFGGAFHSATRQCFLYTMARLYEEPVSPYRGNPELFDRLRSVLVFTGTLQNRDGSFSEWYKGQSSYCASAYLAAYLSETMLRLSRSLDGTPGEMAVRVLATAANRLIRPDPGIPANQLAAAALALRNCSILFGGSWDRGAHAVRDRLLASQATGGWFSEYGGPDLGYQTLTLDFLTRCLERGMGEVQDPILRGIAFLHRHVLPDGTAPPGLSWRGTGFLMPYALEWWAQHSKAAADLSRCLHGALEENRVPSPATVDDRYAAHLFLPSFVDAHFARIGVGPPPDSAPIASREPPDLEDGGLRTVSDGSLVCTLQARTGAVSVYSRPLGKVLGNGPEYRICLPWGSFRPALSETFRFPEASKYCMESSFRKIRGVGVAVRVGMFLLPLAASIGQRIGAGIPARLDSLVRNTAFGTGREIPVRLRRSVSAGGDSVRIRDSIGPAVSASRGTLFCSFRSVPSRHPSSGFGTNSELERCPLAIAGLEERVQDAWASAGSVDLEMKIEGIGSGARFRIILNGKEIDTEVACAGLLR